MSIRTRNAGKSSFLKIIAHIGAILTVTAWGLSFVSTKALMTDGEFTPVEMFSYRFFAAYIVLLLFTCRKSLLSLNWRDELTFVVCGVCSGSLYFITENFALENTTAANVSMLASTSPLFTTALIAFMYKQRVSSGVMIGSIAALIGVGCIIFSSGTGLEIHPKGDLLALAASLSWAIYSLLVKRLLPLYNGFFITRKLFFYGVLTSLPLLFTQSEPLHYSALIGPNALYLILNFLFLILICSATAYVIWNETMKVLGPVTTNNYLYAQPVVTMIAAALFLGEGMTLLGILGCVLIIGGLIVTDHLPGAKRAAKPSSDSDEFESLE